jgi:hypothetical protein
MSLHVIAAAGYGCQFEWESAAIVPPGHRLSFRDSICLTLDNLITLLMAPEWLRKLPFRHMRETQLSYIEFRKYLHDIISMGRQQVNTKSGIGENNILNALVRHSKETASTERVLTDDEIIGNAFIFLLAGHDSRYFLFSRRGLTLAEMRYYTRSIYWLCIPRCKRKHTRKLKPPETVVHYSRIFHR